MDQRPRLRRHTALRVQERLLLPLPRITKRCMDLMLIVLALPVLLPIMALVAALIKLDSAGPIFYSQERVGMRGRLFEPGSSARWRSTPRNSCKSIWPAIRRCRVGTNAEVAPRSTRDACGSAAAENQLG